MAINDKQLRFVEEYIIDLNATQAAIRAEYSEKTAYSVGQRLLKNAEIQKAVQAAMHRRSERTEVTQDRVVAELAKIAFAKFTDYADYKTLLRIIEYNDDGEPVYDWVPTVIAKDSEEIDSSAIQEVSVGRDGTFKFKLYNKLDALEKLGRHTGAFLDKPETDAATVAAINANILSIATLIQNPRPNRELPDE